MNTATTIRTVAHMEGHSGPSLTCTTMDPDRDGDRIMPQGAQLKNFLKNPVLLFSHQAKDLPIGKVTSLQISETGIRAQWTWLQNDPLADRAANAWQQGVLNSASIGFLPKQMKPNAHGGYDILAWELLEISLVALRQSHGDTRAEVLGDARTGPRRARQIGSVAGAGPAVCGD
jgi:HK97 family phage prohead protease